jgi:hypothetical protein
MKSKELDFSWEILIALVKGNSLIVKPKCEDGCVESANKEQTVE